MTDQPEKIAEILNTVASRFVRVFQLRALQALASGTPVDTGYARSGWTPSVGAPMASAEDRPKSESAARSAARARRAQNNAMSRDIATTYKIDFGPVFVSNAVPYLVYLNLGSSAQAGAKFV